MSGRASVLSCAGMQPVGFRVAIVDFGRGGVLRFTAFLRSPR
jgi:hypothetical protein